MQDMIAQIVEMDRKAQLITEEAQREKVRTEQEVLKKREQIREEYLSRARERIMRNEATERQAAEEALEAAQQRYAQAAALLDRQYAEKSEQWVSALVNRVIGE
ncbi:MAG: hypothetical protein HFE39_02265 [Clostridiales bacterium]|jgi:hypothetical protein|nr:hypothetical protein [Clostridiales bacterium]